MNGWNPPYPDWAAQLPTLHRAVQDAARRIGAAVIIPGNVYVFGPDSPSPWRETSPHLATNPLGRIRRDMEGSYRASGVQTILVRAGDFIDTRASGNWFDRILTAKLARDRFVWPGDPDVPHARAYLPDILQAVVQLAEARATLPRYFDLNFPGYTLSGRQMAGLLSEIVDRPIALHSMSWLPLRILSPVNPMMRCLVEMSYLWRLGHSLDATSFAQQLPGFVSTSPKQALANAIAHLGLGQDQVHPDQTMAAGR